MKRWITTILLIFFCAVFAVSAYFLIDYFLEARKEQNTFDELAAIVDNAQHTAPTDATIQKIDSPDPEETTEQPPEEDLSGLVPVIDPGTGATVYVLPEYAELYTINSDIVGWMTIEGTDINHPVMHRPEDKDYYLHRDFYGEYSFRGCFYLQEVCSMDPHSDNVTIYGHNMTDGTMMADLHKYKKESFWEEHKAIIFNTLTKYQEYEILAVFRTSVSESADFHYNTFIDAYDAEDFDNYIQKCKERSYYDTGVTAQYGDKLITLSTCDRSITNGRLVVVAKLITQ